MGWEKGVVVKQANFFGAICSRECGRLNDDDGDGGETINLVGERRMRMKRMRRVTLQSRLKSRRKRGREGRATNEFGLSGVIGA